MSFAGKYKLYDRQKTNRSDNLIAHDALRIVKGTLVRFNRICRSQTTAKMSLSA